MNKLTIYCLAVALTFPQIMPAQEFKTVKDRNFWNAGRNVNGLRSDSLTVSYAELYGGYEDGNYRNTYESKSMWKAGARAETITQLKKFSMAGAFSFEHSDGRDMCGSMSSRPGYYPVDMLEFTPGRKTSQSYSISGGVTADVAENWRIGGKLDFNSRNYTKRKDLRHTDYLLDLTVAPSFLWHRGEWAAGASYIFSKNSETITAEELGITSGSYYAFLDKGLRYGTYDVWDNSGLHLNEAGVNGFPTREFYNGGAVQFSWRNLFIEAEYGFRSGKSGEKQKIWYDFGGDEFSVMLGYMLRGREVDYYFRGGFSLRNMDNEENILEDISENGVTTTRKYGSNEVYTRQVSDMNLSWNVAMGLFRFGLGADWNRSREAAAVMFPYVETSLTDIVSVDMDMYIPAGHFAIGVYGRVRKGWRDEDSRTVSSAVLPDMEPFRLKEYYDIEREYVTRASFDIALSLRYNFRRGVYIEGAANPSGTFRKPEFIGGNQRLSVLLKAGISF